MKPLRLSLPRPARWAHDGLALGMLFGWILSFPLFGPLLMRGGGEQAPLLGILYLFVHGAGLLTLHLLPPAVGESQSGVRSAGALLALGTILFPAMGRLAGLQLAAITVLALLSAYLVLAWTPLLSKSENPLASLTLAMATANLVLALANLPLPDEASSAWGLLAMLPLLGAYSIATAHDRPDPSPAPSPRPRALWPAVLPLGAFALADYFVGGIWYQAATAASVDGGAWRPTFESLLSAAGVSLFYLRARSSHTSALVRDCLSLLGLGLLLAAAGAAGPLGVMAYRSLLLVGLVAGDLFYWHQLWSLGTALGVRRIMGLGLGSSLWLIGAASLITAHPAAPLPSRLFLVIGAVILFLAIPVIYRYPSVGGGRRNQAAAEPVAALILRRLSEAEQQVYKLLINGATDQEIAEQLFISKHTVKFHVRNILHKVGVANRRELLARLLVGQSAAASQHLRRE
ncbi:MAG: helix-turn-helix domain-containing protein [Bacillota bacterium]